MPEDFNKQENEPVVNNDNKPIIEIPEKYYQKLEQERQEEMAAKLKKEQSDKVDNENLHRNMGVMANAFINAIITFGTVYAMLNVNRKLILILPVYFLIITISGALKDKKESNIPVSILVGGILCAIIAFIISLVQDSQMDLWTYYSIAFASIGFLGLLTSSIISHLIVDHKNIKALETIGIFLYFAFIIAGPIFLYKKFPEQFRRIVFREETIVVAKTEDEFLIKTLKNRYNVDFTCQRGRRTNNASGHSTVAYTCKDPSNNEVKVLSTVYNESDVEYIIQDNYSDFLYLKKLKDNLAAKIKTTTGSTATIYLYPKKGCSFVGDCHDCDEYTAIYKEENDLDNLYEFSKNLNFNPYLNLNYTDFANQYEFKYIIEVSGNYNSLSPNDDTISSILSILNTAKLKNTYGYEIILKNSTQYNRIVYKVKGSTNSTEEFNNPQVIDLS